MIPLNFTMRCSQEAENGPVGGFSQYGDFETIMKTPDLSAIIFTSIYIYLYSNPIVICEQLCWGYQRSQIGTSVWNDLAFSLSLSVSLPSSLPSPSLPVPLSSLPLPSLSFLSPLSACIKITCSQEFTWLCGANFLNLAMQIMQRCTWSSRRYLRYVL